MMQLQWFSFSYYETSGNTTTSYCDHTFNGWYHTDDLSSWGCYAGQKSQSKTLVGVRV